MSVSPTVLVACDDLILLDEVIRHLEEIPHWKLVMSARTVDELLNTDKQPDCVLVSEGLITQLAGHAGAPRITAGLVAFGRRESTATLRAALQLGARGFVLWPDQRAHIRVLVERGMAVQTPAASPSGALHAVWAPKGGAGATVIAAHLAGAFARLSIRSILVDLDLDHADQSCVLGADAETKTVADLLRVADELSFQTVQSVLWSHPLGFKAVLAPGRLGSNAGADMAAVRRVLRSIREVTEHVVADLPSGSSRLAVAAMQEATSIHVVLTPDLLGLKRTRDLLRDLNGSDIGSSRITVVLNQAGGSEISQKEIEAVLDVAEVNRIRADLQIYRAVNRGELSPLACKLLTPLARRLMVSSGGEDGGDSTRRTVLGAGEPMRAPAGSVLGAPSPQRQERPPASAKARTGGRPAMRSRD